MPRVFVEKAVFWCGASSHEEGWLEKGRKLTTLSDDRIKAMVKCQKSPAMAGKYIILVLDDITFKTHNNKVFTALIKVHSRHDRIMIIFAVQNGSMISPVSRVNSDVIICTSPNNQIVSELHKLSREGNFYKFREKFDGVIPKKRCLYLHKSNGDSYLVDTPRCDNPFE